VARTGRDVVEFVEDFSSSKINPLFVLDDRGNCEWRVASGVLTLDMGGSPSDAGLLILNEPLDLTKEMTFKVRARAYNYGGGGWGPNSCLLSLAQATGRAEDIIWADGMIVCTVSNIADGRFIIAYRNADSDIEWHPGAGWEKTTGCSFKTDPTAYHTIEFHSNGTEWSITVKDATDKPLACTDPVPWKSVRNTDKAWYFNMGEASVGYYYSDMDVDYVHATYTPKNDRLIIENFDSKTPDDHFEIVKSGDCSWNVSSGMLKLEQCGKESDAGIVLLKDNLNVAMPIDIETKVRFSKATMPGWYGYSCFTIGQSANAPGILGGFDGQISVLETPEGNIRLLYVTPAVEVKVWNGSGWETCTANTVSYKAKSGEFRILEFHSDGCNWNIVLKDEAGRLLTRTSPVPWKNVRNSGASYKFFFGEWGTGYYSADMDVDYIHASYTKQSDKSKILIR
jgi:hypothetical protein